MDWKGKDDPACPLNWTHRRRMAAVSVEWWWWRVPRLCRAAWGSSNDADLVLPIRMILSTTQKCWHLRSVACFHDAQTLVVAAFTFLSPLSSTMIAPASGQIATKFGITNEVIIAMTVSIFVLAYSVSTACVFGISVMGLGLTRVSDGVAGGPAVPRPPFGALRTDARATACQPGLPHLQPCLWICYQHRAIARLPVHRRPGWFRPARYVGTSERASADRDRWQRHSARGLGENAPLTGMLVFAGIGAGVLGDLWRAEERGTAAAYYSLGPLLGPAVGPIIGGWIAQKVPNDGYRWIFFSSTSESLIYQGFGRGAEVD